MHPAPSVILFTSLSGLGFGLMFWLGLGLGPDQTSFAWTASIIAGLCAVGGLLSSTLHLGHPERAIKALSQWRSSWLSREGVFAVALLMIYGLYFLQWAFWGHRSMIFGLLIALLALATVYATAMIYAQLKTIPRWNSGFTPLLYLAYSLVGSYLLFLAVKALFMSPGRQQVVVSLAFLVAGLLSYILYKTYAGQKPLSDGGTPESATGLGAMGQVSLLESPHSSPNYLMKEMVFQVGRRKAKALSRLAYGLGFALPMLCLLAWLVLAPNALWLWTAIVSHLLGTFASRWLFFAEAQHVVSLYYGHR